MSNLSANQIANEFDLIVEGSTTNNITSFGSKINNTEHTISWVKNEHFLEHFEKGYVIVHNSVSRDPSNSLTYLVTNANPRLVFANILTKYFKPNPMDALINCADDHRKKESVHIGENVFIGINVKIGANTIIYPNVVIERDTIIGENCIIKAHVSLGTYGLGFIPHPETQELIKFPQLGNVVLGDNIEIGPISTVRRSALDSTIIKSGCKIGSLVNIGHNCIIDENCILTCQIVTAGSSQIGKNVVMGVNSILRNGVNVGNNAVIGMGAVVLNDVPDGKTVVGNPARIL